jgi:hypothetical protein
VVRRITGGQATAVRYECATTSTKSGLSNEVPTGGTTQPHLGPDTTLM